MARVSELTWFLGFSVQLISLSMILSKPIHVVANGRASPFLVAEQGSIGGMHRVFSVRRLQKDTLASPCLGHRE